MYVGPGGRACPGPGGCVDEPWYGLPEASRAASSSCPAPPPPGGPPSLLLLHCSFVRWWHSEWARLFPAPQSASCLAACSWLCWEYLHYRKLQTPYLPESHLLTLTSTPPVTPGTCVGEPPEMNSPLPRCLWNWHREELKESSVNSNQGAGEWKGNQPTVLSADPTPSGTRASAC